MPIKLRITVSPHRNILLVFVSGAAGSLGCLLLLLVLLGAEFGISLRLLHNFGLPEDIGGLTGI